MTGGNTSTIKGSISGDTKLFTQYSILIFLVLDLYKPEKSVVEQAVSCISMESLLLRPHVIRL